MTGRAPGRSQAGQHPAGGSPDVLVGRGADMEPALQVCALTAGYTPEVDILNGVNLEVGPGEIVTVLGPNGAGKSTLMKAIAGLVAARSGNVTLFGADLAGAAAHSMVRRGLAYVPQVRNIFARLNVEENLDLGAYARGDRGAIAQDKQRMFGLFPRLKERSWQAGGTLSGGEQQMLAVGRALMSRPKLMMMDEPSLGLAPLIVRDIFSIIKEINKRGVTILLIEQNANMALSTADTGYVMETGRITMTGPGKELLMNEAVKAAYLGT